MIYNDRSVSRLLPVSLYLMIFFQLERIISSAVNCAFLNVPSSARENKLTFFRCGMGWMLTFIPYGTFWKDARRAFHRGLGNEAVKSYVDVEVAAARNLLVRLHKSPELFMDHLRQ